MAFPFILVFQPGILKNVGLLLLSLLFSPILWAQYSSIATDVSVLRSFTKGSRFWAFGQTVQAQYHAGAKTTAYAWVSYYTAGKFQNRLSASAIDSATSPQRLNYTAKGSLRFRHISLGFKHYFKGSYNTESTWSLYGLAGFGMLLIKASNTYDQAIDTALYMVPQKAIAGTKNLVRLTADLGLGAETLLGSGIYLYADVRTWIQTTRFRSPYLYNQAVPRVAVLSGGIRILFD